jgi:hypothetical protein
MMYVGGWGDGTAHAPNCKALLSQPETLVALQAIVMPANLADTSTLRADTLPGVDAAAGALWNMAVASESTREALLAHDSLFEALIFLLQRMVAARLGPDDRDWRLRSTRLQLATGALCSLLTTISGVQRMFKHKLEDLAPKKPPVRPKRVSRHSQVRLWGLGLLRRACRGFGCLSIGGLVRQLSVAQRKKLGLGGPGLADVDKLTPWRVLLACCEQRSDPSVPLTAPPAEELALRALRFALLSPLAPKVRLETRVGGRERAHEKFSYRLPGPFTARTHRASQSGRARARQSLRGPEREAEM